VYGVSLTNTPAQNAAAIQQAFTDVTTNGSSRLGYPLYLRSNSAGLPYPCNTLTLPSEPVTMFGDGPVLSVLGTTAGTLLTYNPAVAPLRGTGDPWSDLNTGITSGIHYRSNSWNIYDLGFTKTDNWTGNTGTLVSFPNWTAGTGNLLVLHMDNCLITNANGNGFVLGIDGVRSENLITRVVADSCAGIGITLPSDTLASDLESNNNAANGLSITGSAVVVTNIKCYSNGGNATTFASSTAGVLLVNGNGGTVITGLYTQDNNGPGLYIHNGQNIKVQMVADRNAWNGSTLNASNQAGVVVNGAFGCDLEIVATDSFTGTKPNGQTHGVLVQQTDGTYNGGVAPWNANFGNRIRVTQTQTFGATNTVGATVDANSVLDGCQMITNSITQPRVKLANAPGATPSVNSDTFDVYRFTGLAAAITSMTTNLTGTPVDGQTLVISLTDNGTARAITWGASFEASTVALPATTVASARLDVSFRWNTVTSKWRCVSVA
jgi:hypothetical protein